MSRGNEPRFIVLLLIALSVSGISLQILSFSLSMALQPKDSKGTVEKGSLDAANSFNGYVKNTLILSNGTLREGNLAQSNGYTIDVPTAVAYDSQDNMIFVTNGRSLASNRSTNNVTVIEASTNKIITTLHVMDPRGIAYDPTNDFLYVASQSGITVINAATRTIVAYVILGTSSSGVAYDPSNNQVYVSGYSSSSVAIIDATKYTLVANVTVGVNPTGIAFDPDNNNVYVNCLQSGVASIISGTTNHVTNVTIIPSISPPVQPRFAQPPFQNIAYDTSNSMVYMTNYLAGVGVYVLATANNYHYVFGGGEIFGAVAYDSINNELYLTSGSNDGSYAFLGQNLLALEPNAAKILANDTIGYGPVGIAYDSQNSKLYVANSRSDSISVIDTSTNKVDTTILVQTYPSAVAYDSKNGMLYVANEGSFYATAYKDSWSINIFAVNTTTGAVLPIVTGLVGPMNLLYDPNNNYLYVLNLEFGIIVVDTSTNTVVGKIPLPAGEFGGIILDSVHHMIYVAVNSLYNSHSVVSIDDSTNTVVRTIDAGWCALGLAYDPANDGIYVTHYCPPNDTPQNFVTVIDGASSQIVANVTVGSKPTGVLYNPANSAIYVADTGSNQVSVINDMTNTVTATISLKERFPEGLIYDPVNDQMLVTNQFPAGFSPQLSNVTAVIDGSTNSLLGNFTLGYNPTDGVYDPADGYVYVTNYGSGTLSVLASTPKKDFSLSVNPSTLSIAAGSTTSATITGTGDPGLTASVNLKATVSQNGPTASLDHSSVSLSPSQETGSALLALDSYGSAPGSYTVLVNATTTGLFHTTTLLLTVTVTASVGCGKDLNCSVRSNSTLSNIKFAGNTIHIEADGPHNAGGYANVTVPKSAIPHIDTLHVLVDNSKLDSSRVTITSDSTNYYIYFTFTFHSPVLIDIQLTIPENAATPNILGLDPTIFYTIAGVAVAIAVVVVGFAYRARSKSKPAVS